MNRHGTIKEPRQKAVAPLLGAGRTPDASTFNISPQDTETRIGPAQAVGEDPEPFAGAPAVRGAG
jgi:hypothetical protein